MTPAGDRQSAILVFAKEPEPGAVKTRLIPAIGETAATAVYRSLLEQALTCAAQVPVTGRYLYAEKAPAEGMLDTRSAALGLDLRLQNGQGLGDRMYSAFSETMARYAQAVLIGSDCPEYTPDYVAAALDALADHDAVIGPAHDGGYVLLALRRLDRQIFDGIAWSTDRVLTQTRERLRSLSWTWAELAPLHDVDDADALSRFPALAAAASEHAES